MNLFLRFLLSLLLFSPLFATLFAQRTGLTGPVRPIEAHTLRLTENKGQWHPNVKYRTTTGSDWIYLENNGIRYQMMDAEQLRLIHPAKPGSLPFKYLRGHTYFMEFEGGNLQPVFQNGPAYPDYENYFLGKNPAKWSQYVKSFGEVTYQNVWKGIDLKIKTGERSLKYDLVLAPEAAPRNVRLKYTGTCKLSLKEGKSLVIRTSIGERVETIPAAWQDINGQRKFIKCEYVLLNDTTVGFRFPEGYLNDFPLVIDPELVFSTYTGSRSDNWGMTATYDRSGNLYSGGVVNGPEYPVTTGAFQASFEGGADVPLDFAEVSVGFTCDMAIVKYNPTGTQRLYSTYLGGSNNDQPASIIANEKEELFIFGTTRSNNYPVKSGCYDDTFNGQFARDASGDIDIVVTKLNKDGTDLIGSTYIGSNQEDGTNRVNREDYTNPLYYFFADNGRGEIVIDRDDNCYVATSTSSPNFPVTANAPQRSFRGDQDGIVFSFNSDLSVLRWSTFLGGTDMDAAYSLKLNDRNELYVTGGTVSSNFFATPTTGWQNTYQGGGADGFLVHYSADGSQILQGTFIGTSEFDQNYFIDLDDDFNVYIAGISEGNYPAFGTAYNRPNGRQFVTKLRPDLTQPIFSFRYGSNDIRRRRPDITLTAFLVDVCQNIYIAGWGSNGNTLRPFFITDPNITSGNTLGLPVTDDAFSRTTGGSDFYIAVFTRDAADLRFATFIGGTHTADHVDGGTSRFDKNGIIYHSVCGSCQPGADAACPRGPQNGCSDFPTTPGVVSRTNNSRNCNNLNFKFKIDLLDAALAEFTFDTAGSEFCLPLRVDFRNQSKGAARYEWDLGDGTTTEAENPVHNYTRPGKYRIRLRAINEAKCNGSDETFRDLTIREPSSANFELRIDTCERKINITNTSASAGRWLWSYGDGKTWSGPNPPEHTYELPGRYTVRLITDPGSRCSDTLTRTLFFPEIPQPFGTFELERCNPEVVFDSRLPDSIPVLWDLGDGTFSAEHKFSYKYAESKSYTVRLKAYPNLSCFKEWVDSFTIVQKAEADFRHTPLTCLRNVSFTCLTQADSVLWDFGDGQTSKEFSPIHLYIEEKDYTVRLITNPGSFCADTMEKVLAFRPLPPANVKVEFDRCILTVRAVNTTDTLIKTHYWDFGDGKIYNTRSPNHTYTEPGRYTVRYIANPGGGDCSREVNLQVEIFPKSEANFRAQPNCFGEVMFFDLSKFASTFIWDFGDGETGTGQRPVHRYRSPGVYPVSLITNARTSCADTVTKPVVIPAFSESNFRFEPELCSGKVSFFNLSKGSIGEFYWDFGDGNISKEENPIHIYKIAGTYAVRMITNPTTVCPNTSERIVEPSVKSYAEIAMPKLFCDSLVTLAHKARNTIAYKWLVNDSVISSESNPQFRFKGNASSKITLITNPDGPCPDTAEIQVRVQAIPEARFEPINKPCDLFVRFENSSREAETFLWEFGDGNTSTVRFPSHTYLKYGVYKVRLTVNKDSLCFDRNERTFAFGNPPDIDFDLDVDPCDSVVSLRPVRPIAKEYLWDFGDGSFSVEKEPAHRYKKHGKYVIKLVTDPGTLCEREIEKPIELKKKVKADFDFKQKGCEPLVTFTNKSVNGFDYLWIFGDGTYSRQDLPVKKYSESGLYRIGLVAFDANDCSDTVYKVFDFSSIGGALLEIPNVFSPNGDGTNDFFEIRGPYDACFEHIMIFDRWGVKVFETRNLTEAWDGTFNGDPVAEGAYVFVVTIKGLQRVGTVTVLR